MSFGIFSAGIKRSVVRCLSTVAAAIFFAALGSSPMLAAQPLTWTGRYSEIWDLTEKNWVNSLGEEVAFTNNAHAVFDDTAESFTVRFTNNAVKASTVIFDTDSTYTLTNSATMQYLMSATAIRKRGEGQLVMFPGKSILLHTVAEGFFVDEGTAVFGGQKSFEYLKKNPEMVFSAGENATLHLAMRNIFDNNLFNSIPTPIVISNGTFKASDVNGHIAIGPLTLDNASFDYSGLRGYDPTLGAMTFSGKITFKGNEPYQILQEGFLQDKYPKYKKFNLWSDPKTEFCVEDITGDSAEDVIFGAHLSDHCKQTAYTDKEDPSKNRELVMAPGGLIKTGAGTLALTNGNNSFSGDIEVREGVLQAGPNLATKIHAADLVKTAYDHWLGCLTNENRKITVYSGASLYFPNRNLFGAQGAITNLCAGVNVELVFDGGVFTNFNDQGFLLPNVTFSNGGHIAPGYGPGNYGRFMVKERFSVKGNVPFVWNLSAAALLPNATDRISREALSLNGYPENVFDIEDVTGDVEIDATFGVPFIIGYGYFRADTDAGNHFLDDWKFGFRKTGAGTMRITAPKINTSSDKNPNSLLACRSFNGDAKVEEGELRVDGDLSLSGTVCVSAGACLSGTGLVNNVSIASGGFLRVPNGQADCLRIGGMLSAKSGMKVECVLAEGADIKSVRAKVLSVSGDVDGLDSLISAPVVVDGEVEPNIALRLDNGILRMRYMYGTTVVIR